MVRDGPMPHRIVVLDLHQLAFFTHSFGPSHPHLQSDCYFLFYPQTSTCYER